MDLCSELEQSLCRIHGTRRTPAIIHIKNYIVLKFKYNQKTIYSVPEIQHAIQCIAQPGTGSLKRVNNIDFMEAGL